jgi:YihY family inner membrane protein
MKGPSPKPGSMLVASTIRARPAAPVSRSSRLGQGTRRVWVILCLAVKTFLRIDGAQWASAFAFNAFFSLLPLMILLVTIASFFVDRDRAGTAVVAYMESYVPISGEMQRHIFDALAGVITAREQAGAVALLILVWAALQCFTTLICATNRAWGTEVYNWWRLPLNSLVLLGVTAGAVLLGMAAPVLTKMAKDWLFPVNDFRSWVYALGSFVIPLLVVCFGLSLFYRLAPRRPTQFTEVWAAALCATALLQTAESLFVIYLKNFATFNAVYGAFGGIMALLLWIYLSGCVFILGACLCAGQAEALELIADQPVLANPRTGSLEMPQDPPLR